MNAASNLGELQSVLVGAMRCVECSDPRCLATCPEHVDVRAAMRLIIARAPGERPAAWMQREQEAAASARDAIEASFQDR